MGDCACGGLGAAERGEKRTALADRRSGGERRIKQKNMFLSQIAKRKKQIWLATQKKKEAKGGEGRGTAASSRHLPSASNAFRLAGSGLGEKKNK